MIKQLLNKVHTFKANKAICKAINDCI